MHARLILWVLIFGAIAVGGVSCRHSTSAQGSPAEGATAPRTHEESAATESLRACSTTDQCVLIALVPDGGHSECKVAVNRNKVAEFYEVNWKAHEADLRKIDSLSNCRGQRGVVCSDGLCYSE